VPPRSSEPERPRLGGKRYEVRGPGSLAGISIGGALFAVSVMLAFLGVPVALDLVCALAGAAIIWLSVSGLRATLVVHDAGIEKLAPSGRGTVMKYDEMITVLRTSEKGGYVFVHREGAALRFEPQFAKEDPRAMQSAVDLAVKIATASAKRLIAEGGTWAPPGGEIALTKTNLMIKTKRHERVVPIKEITAVRGDQIVGKHGGLGASPHIGADLVLHALLKQQLDDR
jgi:hypothetical protein